MKILILHNQYQQRGGEDVVFETESALLAKNGHSVNRVLFNNAEIKSFKDKLLSGFRSIYNAQSARKLASAIDEFQPDVIHVHNFFPLASPSIFFVAKKRRIPVIVTIHNYRLLCPSTFLFFKNAVYEKSIRQMFPLDAVMKGVYHNSKVQTAAVALMSGIHKLIGTWRKKVDKYIILTEFAKSKFVDSSLHLREDQIIVKPNSVTDLGVGQDVRDDFFLFVGRLSEEKGIDTLLKAAEKHRFNVRIIGDGPFRGLVEAYAAKHPNISYLGFRDGAFIANELKKCKALLLTSVWYEGFPMTILEAFSTGTPVIASKLGGPAEIIADGITGLHVEPGNADKLAEKIQWMNAHPAETWQMGIRARKAYEENYTPDKNYTMLIQAYEETIMAQRQWVVTRQPSRVPVYTKVNALS